MAFLVTFSFLTHCATHKLWNNPQLVLKEAYFDTDGGFVIIASNVLSISICRNKECVTQDVTSLFVDSRFVLKVDISTEESGADVFLVTLYDIIGKRRVTFEVDFDNRRIINLQIH